jgi:hypothetical protein
LPKIVFGAWYVHRDHIDDLPGNLQALWKRAQALCSPTHEWNLLRIDERARRVTFAHYPAFFDDPHPELDEWTTLHLDTGTTRHCHSHSTNTLILHRKETFICESDPRYHAFAQLSLEEEKAGLYAPAILRRIGRKAFWDSLLVRHGLIIQGHTLRRVRS